MQRGARDAQIWKNLLKHKQMPVLDNPKYYSTLSGEACFYGVGSETPQIYRVSMEDVGKEMPKMKVYRLVVRLLDSPEPDNLSNALKLFRFDPAQRRVLTFPQIQKVYAAYNKYIKILDDSRPKTLKAQRKIDRAFLLLQKEYTNNQPHYATL